MALRRSSQSAWGLSPERELSPKILALIGVVLLLLGALSGWFIRGSDDAPKDKNTDQQSQGIIIEPAISSLLDADRSENGAIKAGTALITGLSSLSVQSSGARGIAIGQIAAPDAVPELVPAVESSMSQLRQTFLGSPGSEHVPVARMVVMPMTFKTDVTVPDRARVVIWYVTVLIDPATKDVKSTWSTADMRLAWSDHWRLVSYDGVLGPTPALYAPNAIVSEYEDVVKVFDGFKAYRSAVR